MRQEMNHLIRIRKNILEGELVKGSLKSSGIWNDYIDKIDTWKEAVAFPVRIHTEGKIGVRNETAHDVSITKDYE